MQRLLFDGEQCGGAAHHGVLVRQEGHHLMKHGVADTLSAGQQAPEGRQRALCKCYGFLYPIRPASASLAQCPWLLDMGCTSASTAAKPCHA